MSEQTDAPPDGPPPSYESVIQSPAAVPYVPGTEPKDNYNIPTYGGYPAPQPPVPTSAGGSQPYPTQPAYPTQATGQYPAGTYPQTGYGYPPSNGPGAYPGYVQGQQPQYNMPYGQPPGQVVAPGIYTTNTSIGVNAQNNVRRKKAMICTMVMISVFIAIIIFIMQITF